uniref:Ig-like domain-containing protein n=1 Tax=Dicentrarchus labrax TaxID=13489 RepID=A0A8C4E8W4_DICLA
MFFSIFVFLSSAQTTNLESPIYVRQDSGFVSANVGENVTMRCFYQGDAMMFYWYKQTLGQKPRLVSTYYKHDKSGIFDKEFKNNPRFSLKTGNGTNHLIISDLHISDSATYYCTGCFRYDLEFVEGVTVNVKGSGLNIPASVQTIQPGGSMTLNCTVHTGTCDGEHSVYWFKTSEESHPGLIYTHGGRNDQCERKPNNQTHTCVYNLPMQSLNLSQAGTDCAVASCGHMLFGEDKKLDLEHEVHSFGLVYFLTGALAFTTTLVVLLAYAVYTINNRPCCQCKDSRSSAALTLNAVDYSNSDNLHYAALKAHKVNRSTRLRNDVQSECVYSGVRQ